MAKYNPLTPAARRIIIDKGTEPPFSGEYNQHFSPGVYVCGQCNAPLYQSSSKFPSQCGWPSFDDEIPGMVNRFTDADGQRIEITCANCEGHLGHVFTGEYLTKKNTRHCVNSLSLYFINQDDYDKHYETAVFASGCFWGTEYWFKKTDGVIATIVGYAGGNTEKPTYQQVCAGGTGHAESVRVIFDPTLITYEQIVKLFYETHDPTQINGQGPDIGSQYRSVIFYLKAEQREVAELVSAMLREKGYNLATKIEPLNVFYPERDVYHQHYYHKKNALPYCHVYEKKF